ncbi:FecR family protein [Algoriphagus chordae]|uniref:FecR family protein n=1 Tax=Algoriphagus chordae TaxID=237019 RepID=A0A2W7RAJ5_9BACT|nr:FecR domain-containing protein [Algoriphagus chordae]PZX52687.1 FecR family protein [Algoriphagus chordae]
MAKNQYNSHVYELLTNELFVQHVFDPNENTDAYFQNEISKGRINEEVFKSALSIAKSWNKNNEVPLKIPAEEGYLDLETRLQKEKKSFTSWKPLIGLAASISIIILIVIGTLYNDPVQEATFITLETGFGETKDYHLKDNSEIKLFPNSRVRIDTSDMNSSRKVYLEMGKAYFNVEKMADASDFQVSLDDMNVKVLGTQFLVESLEESDKVVLREGSVEVSTVVGGEKLLLTPGQSAELLPGAKKLIVDDVNLLREFAWLNGKIYLKDDSLNKVADLISRYYNIEVKFESEDLRNKTLTGDFPIDDIQLLINILETTLNLSIEYEQNLITINHQ